MDVFLDTNKALGLGDQLCLLSMLARIPDKVSLHTNNRENYFDKLKVLVDSLRIPIELKRTTLEGDFAGAYHLKTVCNYFYPKIVPYGANKGYIGLVLYNSADGYVDHDYNFIRVDGKGNSFSEGTVNRYGLPQRKFRSLDVYARAFELCRRTGFDIITLDSQDKFEQKLDFLAKNCAAVVGYEGGIAHLCHMLKIPFFMFDHQYPNNGPYGPFQVEVMHQSRTLHIIRDEEEFLNMSALQFRELIATTRSGNGNNRIVNSQIRMSFDNGVINSPISFYNHDYSEFLFRSTFGPQVSESAASIINQYFQIPKV